MEDASTSNFTMFNSDDLRWFQPMSMARTVSLMVLGPWDAGSSTVSNTDQEHLMSDPIRLWVIDSNAIKNEWTDSWVH